jgi:hypothetical protein
VRIWQVGATAGTCLRVLQTVLKGCMVTSACVLPSSIVASSLDTDPSHTIYLWDSECGE